MGATLTILAIFVNAITQTYAHGYRVGAMGYAPIDLGGVLALALPPAWYLGWHYRTLHPYLALYNWLVIPFGMAAILLTGSRHSLVAAAFIVPYIGYSLYSQPSIRVHLRSPFNVATGVVVSTGGVAGGLVLLPEYIRQRLYELPHDIMMLDLTGRLPRWVVATEILRNNPIVGAGVGSFPVLAEGRLLKLTSPPHPNYFVADSFFAATASNLGLLGLGLIIAMYYVTVRDAIRTWGNVNALWVTLIGMWVILAGLNTFGIQMAAWLMFGLAWASLYRVENT